MADAANCGERPNAAFYGYFSFSVLALALLLFFLTSYIDPHGIFGTKKFPVVLATARSDKCQLVREVNPKPEILILGSSRCMRYSPAEVRQLTGLSTFNYSVNSGKIEDFLVLLRYAIETLNHVPKMIVMGISQRTFCDLSEEGLDNRLISDPRLMKYIPMHAGLQLYRKFTAYFKTIFNHYYLLDAIKSFYLQIRGGEKAPLNYRFHQDGFLAIEGAFDTPGEYPVLTERKTSPDMRFSEERMKYLERFLSICAENKIELKVVITPNSPGYIKNLTRIGLDYDKQIYDLVMAVKEKTHRNHAEIYDFSTIEKYGGIDEFMGGDHPSIYNSTLLLRKLFVDKPDAVY